MTYVQEERSAHDGLTLHTIPTKKFKTNSLVLKMNAPIQEQTVTMRALLPYVLQSSTKNYDTTTKLRSHLDDLYGAALYVDLAKKGDTHTLTFTIDLPNERFLKDRTPLLEKGLQLLQEVLYTPNVVNGQFHEKTVEQEKRTMKARIQAMNDDKMRYSGVRLVEEMCEGEPYALRLNGRSEDVDGITTEALYQYYEQALAEDKMDLYVVGDIEPQEVTKLVTSIFSVPSRERARLEKGEQNKREEVKEVQEEQDVQQGKLNIGYRTDIRYGDKEYPALQLFNGIFGGFSHSKLFINVREKASLAYYAASRLESHKGLVLVMTGIDQKNYDQAVQIVNEQMQAMQTGDFTDDMVEQTKAVLKNQLLETIDTQRGVIEALYHSEIAETKQTLEQWIDAIQAVSKEEVQAVGERINLDTIYFLKGEETA
ncbi:EF-P 5-aminopentanol modification-associated protein YfmF [Bacillus fonticola]|uniref:EF-P 5-aminopentanol modification-associated protein YfmF n=1 Tax=Bacillus fonticola TaxID=2728853 RepID=UPI001D147BFB|nr:pitrilysin family protein [Bacillus fonticola]